MLNAMLNINLSQQINLTLTTVREEKLCIQRDLKTIIPDQSKQRSVPPPCTTMQDVSADTCEPDSFDRCGSFSKILHIKQDESFDPLRGFSSPQLEPS